MPKYYLYLIFFAIISSGALVGIIIYSDFQPKKNNSIRTDSSVKTNLPSPNSLPQNSQASYPEPNENHIIMKVGRENIYQKDLNFELEKYQVVDEETVRKIVGKLQKDSLELQIASDKGAIELNSQIFNSLNKNYLDRSKTLAQAEKSQTLQSGIMAASNSLNNLSSNFPTPTPKTISAMAIKMGKVKTQSGSPQSLNPMMKIVEGFLSIF